MGRAGWSAKWPSKAGSEAATGVEPTTCTRRPLPCLMTTAASVLLALSVAAAPTRAQDTSPPPSPERLEPYTDPQQLVQIARGRRPNLYCTGSGSPTVVMDAWFAGSAWNSAVVQPAVAGLTRVCSYDRAGEGWSDPGPLPRTSSAIVADLHAAVWAARRDLGGGRRPLGALLVVVLQAGDLGDVLSPFDLQSADDLQSAWFQVRTELLDSVAAQSEQGVRVVVPNSGHNIELEQPQAVIDTIRQVVCAARAGTVSSCE